MVKIDVYTNAGEYSHDGTDAYIFANGDLSVELRTSCCDFWETQCSKKNSLEYKGVTRKFRALEKMDGEYIEFVIVQEGGKSFTKDPHSHHEPFENGSITIISDKYFCEMKYCHFHNGYYPNNFIYHTTLTEE